MRGVQDEVQDEIRREVDHLKQIGHLDGEDESRRRGLVWQEAILNEEQNLGRRHEHNIHDDDGDQD